ncbi:MAG TPA: hypothetical protein VND64_22165 [Pirellulales bacterium]|nr:hypothetical protein [Pirellulales bacterium]
MRPKSGAFSRYRPRLLTLIVLMIVAAPIVVANLSHEQGAIQKWWQPPSPPNPSFSFGWPMIWYWTEFPPLVGGVRASCDHNLARWSAPGLAGNLAMWLLMVAVPAVACEWLLRRYGRDLSFRPRLVTLVVLMVVAAPTVLANLSSDELTGNMWGLLPYPAYGWPLVWCWRNSYFGWPGVAMLDWDCSGARLAANLTTWLVMLAAAGGACEWLLRLYRPRLQWNLRTMLAAVGLLAVFCAWCAKLRDRANLQDPIIAEYGDPGQSVALFWDRLGPKWLDLVGADRFRRRVVGVDLTYPLSFPSGRGPGGTDEELLKRLGRLPDMRYLVVCASDLTPDTAAALGEMRQLRMLRIEFLGADKLTAHACFASIGKLTRLERLCLDGLDIRGDDLACMGGLSNLKSLSLSCEDDLDETHELLAALGKLTQLERLCLEGWELGSDDLAHLASLTNLKSLTLEIECNQEKAHECLATLGALTQLERLCLSGIDFRSDDLACLAGLANLRVLGLRDYWPDSSSDEVGTEMEEDSTEEGGENSDELENKDTLQLLAHLPALPRLETIDLEGSAVSDDDLAQLAVVPRLKLLNLTGTLVTDVGLAELASLASLEKLRIDNAIATAAGLESLLRLRRLNSLHIVPAQLEGATHTLFFDGIMNAGLYVREDEVDRCRRALEALRRSNPGIVFDSFTDVFDFNKRRAPTPAPMYRPWAGNRIDLMVYYDFYDW